MSLRTFLKIVETDVEGWALDAEQFLEHEAEIAWSAVKPVLTSIPAELWGILHPLVKEAIAQLEGGSVSVESIGATLLNKAELAGRSELQKLPAELFQAVVSTLIASA